MKKPSLKRELQSKLQPPQVSIPLFRGSKKRTVGLLIRGNSPLLYQSYSLCLCCSKVRQDCLKHTVTKLGSKKADVSKAGHPWPGCPAMQRQRWTWVETLRPTGRCYLLKKSTLKMILNENYQLLYKMEFTCCCWPKKKASKVSTSKEHESSTVRRMLPGIIRLFQRQRRSWKVPGKWYHFALW